MKISCQSATLFVTLLLLHIRQENAFAFPLSDNTIYKSQAQTDQQRHICRGLLSHTICKTVERRSCFSACSLFACKKISQEVVEQRAAALDPKFKRLSSWLDCGNLPHRLLDRAETGISLVARPRKFSTLRLSGGGIRKKLQKGLPLNSSEKAYFDKVKAIGLNRVLQEDEGPTRRQLAEKRNAEIGQKRIAGGAGHTAEKGKDRMAKRLSILAGKKGPASSARGGGRPTDQRHVRKGGLPRAGPRTDADLLTHSQQPQLTQGSEKEKGVGDEDASMSEGGEDEEQGEVVKVVRKPGWLFDEAMKRKL